MLTFVLRYIPFYVHLTISGTSVRRNGCVVVVVVVVTMCTLYCSRMDIHGAFKISGGIDLDHIAMTTSTCHMMYM